MTNVDRRIFDELAHVLKTNNVGNALILQIADVCSRATPKFHRDWFLEEAGYVALTSKSKVLKLGSKMKVVPVRQPEADPPVPKGWDEIEPGPEQSFAPLHPKEGKP